jgi:hypothetical protein
MLLRAHHRYETLKRIIDFNPGIYGIIFTRTRIKRARRRQNDLRVKVLIWTHYHGGDLPKAKEIR